MPKSLFSLTLWALIITLGVGGPLLGQTPAQMEIGFAKLTTDPLNFHALENYLAAQGSQEQGRELQNRLSHMKIGENPFSRYFGAIKVDDARLWSISSGQTGSPEALVAEIQIRLLIYDTELQKELVRETLSGYEVRRDAPKSPQDAVELWKITFKKALATAADKIAQKVPVMGKIIATSGTMITVNLGKNHGLSAAAVLEVLNSSDALVDEFSLAPNKLYSEECKAFSNKDLEMSKYDWHNCYVRVKSAVVAGVEQDKAKLAQSLLGVQWPSPVEKLMLPNPPIRLEITDPRNDHEIYLGGEKDPGSTTLKVIGRDDWGDEVKLEPYKVTWVVAMGGDDMISGSQFIHKRSGLFEIKAKYGTLASTSVHVLITKIQRLLLEPKKLTLLPYQACEFRLLGKNNKDQDVTGANLNYQLEWQVLPPNMVDIHNGRFVAREKPGKCVVTAFLKNNPTVKAQTQILILPQFEAQIVDLQEKPLRKVNLAPGENLEVQYKITAAGVEPLDIPLEWKITPAEAGQKSITGTDLLLTAGTVARRVSIELVLQNVPPDSSRNDDLKPLYVEIAPKRPDKIEMSLLSQEPYIAGESIQLQVKGIAENKPIKDLQFKVAAIPSGNCEVKPEAIYGYYTATPNKPGTIRLIAAEHVSGQEATLPIVVVAAKSPETQQTTRVDVISQNGKSEVRPGQSLLLSATAFCGSQEVRDARFTWSLTPATGTTKIDPSGLLTTGGEDEVGTYVVTATEDKSKISDTLPILVTLDPVGSIKILAPEKLEIGVKYPISAVVFSKEGNRLYNRDIAWSTTDGGIVEKGFLMAEKSGLIRLFAQVANVQESVVIEITKPNVIIVPTKTEPVPQPLAITKMVLTNKEKKSDIAPGDTLSFVADIYSNTKLLDKADIVLKWSVSGGDHKIERDGRFTAGQNIGAVVVTAKEPVSGVAQSFKVRVRWEPVAKIAVSTANMTLAPQQTTLLVCRIFNAQNKEILREKTKIVWKSTGGSLNESTMIYTAPAQPGAYRIWATDSTELKSSNILAVRVKPLEGRPMAQFDKIVIFPQTKELEIGQTFEFDVKGFNSKTQKWFPDLEADWKVEPAGSDHTVSPQGVFQAGVQSGTFQLVATTKLEVGKGNFLDLKAAIPITIRRTPQKLSIQPKIIRLAPGMTKEFTARAYDALENPMELSVVWGTTGLNKIDPKTGLFTAGKTPGTYEVVARANTLIQKAVVEVVALSQDPGAFILQSHFGITFKIHKDWVPNIIEEAQTCAYFTDKTMQSLIAFSVFSRSQARTSEQMLQIMENQILEKMPNLSDLFDTAQYEQKNVHPHKMGNFVGQIATYLISYKVESYDEKADEAAAKPFKTMPIKPTTPAVKPGQQKPGQELAPAKPEQKHPETMKPKKARVIVKQKKFVKVQNFIALKGGHYYCIIYMAPQIEWEIHAPAFKIAAESLQLSAPLDPSNRFAEVQEASYRANYKVDSQWREEAASRHEGEKSTIYFVDDETFIQFSFLNKPGRPEGQFIMGLESYLFDGYRLTRRLSMSSHAVQGLAGKKLNYLLIGKERGEKHHATIFYGVQGNTLYLVHAIYGVRSDDAVVKALEMSLNSLSVKAETQPVEIKPVEQPVVKVNPIIKPPDIKTQPPENKEPDKDALALGVWSDLRDDDFGLRYLVPANWKKLVRRNDEDERLVIFQFEKEAITLRTHFIVDTDSNTLQEAVIHFEKTLSHQRRGWTRKSQEERVIQKWKGVLNSYTFLQQHTNIAYTLACFYFLDEGKFYSWQLTCPTAKLKQFMPYFVKFCSSMESLDTSEKTVKPKKQSKSGKKPKKQKHEEEEDE